MGARCLRLGSIWCPPSIRLPGTGAYIGGESARECGIRTGTENAKANENVASKTQKPKTTPSQQIVSV